MSNNDKKQNFQGENVYLCKNWMMKMKKLNLDVQNIGIEVVCFGQESSDNIGWYIIIVCGGKMVGLIRKIVFLENNIRLVNIL